MDFIASGIALYSERLTVALGFLTLASALATFATCRTCLSFLSRFGIKNPVDAKWYRPFYKLHGFYWWGFVMGLAFHLTAALMHTSWPKESDPDGRIHLLILEFGLASFVFIGAVLSSCRSLINLVSLFSERSPLVNQGFKKFYQYHSFYWLVLALAVAGHIASGYAHIGFWPQ